MNNSDTNGPGRRTLLRRGLALVGGVAAAGTGGLLGRRAAAETTPRRGPTLTIYGRSRPVAGDTGARVMAFGDLYDAPEGGVIGEFHASCFCLPSPAGLEGRAASNLEFHVMHFKDGSLFAMRGGSPDGAAPVAAIVGGTARYAGAAGTLVERPMKGGTRGHDLIEFVMTFAS